MSLNSFKIQKHMTVLDVVSHYQGTDAVFRRYDALTGECICCCCLFETLDGLCQKYGLDVEKLMDELKRSHIPFSREPHK